MIERGLTVIEYCTEEVNRQGHDTGTLEGIERVGWMLDAWSYALLRDGLPTLRDAVNMGIRIERLRVDGIRTQNVRVGSRVCPHFSRVPTLIEDLFNSKTRRSPMEFYKAFEEIHPFIDGNGRTGKILLNWLNGTLLHPIFPPADLWGAPIRNP